MATQPNRKLTGKEQRFAAEYVIDGDGANAARRAGYASSSAKVTACRLLKRADIQGAIAAQKTAIANQPLTVLHGTIADATERREILSVLLRDRETHPIARLKAADILNRMDAIYVQKHDVTHHTKPDLSKLSDAELAALEQLVTKAAPVQAEAVH